MEDRVAKAAYEDDPRRLWRAWVGWANWKGVQYGLYSTEGKMDVDRIRRLRVVIRECFRKAVKDVGIRGRRIGSGEYAKKEFLQYLLDDGQSVETLSYWDFFFLALDWWDCYRDLYQVRMW